jgi:hypothetical protein
MDWWKSGSKGENPKSARTLATEVLNQLKAQLRQPNPVPVVPHQRSTAGAINIPNTQTQLVRDENAIHSFSTKLTYDVQNLFKTKFFYAQSQC